MSKWEHYSCGSEQDALGGGGEVAEVGDGVEDLSGVAEVTRSPHRHVSQPKGAEPEPVRELCPLLMPGQIREDALTRDVSSGEVVVQGELDPEGQTVLGKRVHSCHGMVRSVPGGLVAVGAGLVHAERGADAVGRVLGEFGDERADALAGHLGALEGLILLGQLVVDLVVI